jgi:hypothetical protein
VVLKSSTLQTCYICLVASVLTLRYGCCPCIFFQWLFQPIQYPGLLFCSVIIFTEGRTPWTRDQPVARPLPKHRTAQTQNKRIHTPNIHALSGIRTTIPASERAKAVHALDRAATVTGCWPCLYTNTNTHTHTHTEAAP